MKYRTYFLINSLLFVAIHKGTTAPASSISSQKQHINFFFIFYEAPSEHGRT